MSARNADKGGLRPKQRAEAKKLNALIGEFARLLDFIKG